jgi:hypothetical protein
MNKRRVNIQKKYKTQLKHSNGQDDVIGVEFCEIKDDDGTFACLALYAKQTL